MTSPFIGEMVHYVSFGTPGGEYTRQCRAATVSEVDPEDPCHVGLVVLNPTGMFFHALSDGGSHFNAATEPGGTWHWADHHSGRFPGCIAVMD